MCKLPMALWAEHRRVVGKKADAIFDIVHRTNGGYDCVHCCPVVDDSAGAIEIDILDDGGLLAPGAFSKSEAGSGQVLSIQRLIGPRLPLPGRPNYLLDSIAGAEAAVGPQDGGR